ncbi:hypothetical protein LR48_Vigan08g048000 [Vigna angularis]|uniref:Uncharacterized protein n=1 Tax=Phaseolus angularis TaxID=3914 RepID=A0A0L9V3N3_PHAAN|nr:hypothetical protein LR48_Vigan08g048000 [Vigna angularis]
MTHMAICRSLAKASPDYGGTYLTRLSPVPKSEPWTLIPFVRRDNTHIHVDLHIGKILSVLGQTLTDLLLVPIQKASYQWSSDHDESGGCNNVV